ncbi:MAG TPA: phage integrase SAM-like domain-containing protein [Pyrinomonadaceae bacterium]|jgi:hypothetical protein
MKVTLREKKLKGAKRSLYLDFYPPITRPDTGKQTRREFLSLYVFDKPKTETEREHNKETRILAENVRAKRQLELQAGNYGFLVKKRQNADFLKYSRDLADKRSKNQSVRQIWKSSILYLTDFTNGQCTFENLNQHFVEDFKTYLLNASSRRSKNTLLKSTSASAYFQCFCSTLNP